MTQNVIRLLMIDLAAAERDATGEDSEAENVGLTVTTLMRDLTAQVAETARQARADLGLPPK